MIFILSSLISIAPPVDKVAHFGASYVLTHGMYTVCKKITDKKVPCIVGAVAATTAIGAAREVMGNNDPKDMTANMAGITAAFFVIRMDF